MWLHLSERVLRKYDYVHGIPSSPTVFGALELKEIVTAFQDFLLHIIHKLTGVGRRWINGGVEGGT